MKTAVLCLWMLMQMLVWPIYCADHMRSDKALVCYFATFIAFWLGYFAR